MFWFIFSLLLAAIGVAAAVTAIVHRNDREIRRGGTGLAVVVFIVAGIVAFFSSFTTVDANTVGIETQFGQFTNTLEPGGHFLAPWATVTQIDTKVQSTDRKAGPDGDVPGADCVQVNLKGGAQACADLTVRYSVSHDDAQGLWSQYGSFDDARNKLLRSATDQAAKVVYGEFTPQEAVSGDASASIASKLTDSLRGQLSKSGLNLQAVAPGQLHLSKESQTRFDDLLNAQTATLVAQQNLAKNQAEAAANAALSGSLSEPILVQQCIDAAKVIKPAVFNCFPGTSSPAPLVSVSPGH